MRQIITAIVSCLVILITACQPSEQDIANAIAATQLSATQTQAAIIPTTTPTPTITLESYKANIESYFEENSTISTQIINYQIADATGGLSTSEKNDYIKLLDDQLIVLKKVADEPCPQGYEKACEYLELFYEEMVKRNSLTQVNVISIVQSPDDIKEATSHIEKATEYFRKAFEILGPFK